MIDLRGRQRPNPVCPRPWRKVSLLVPGMAAISGRTCKNFMRFLHVLTTLCERVREPQRHLASQGWARQTLCTHCTTVVGLQTQAVVAGEVQVRQIASQQPVHRPERSSLAFLYRLSQFVWGLSSLEEHMQKSLVMSVFLCWAIQTAADALGGEGVALTAVHRVQDHVESQIGHFCNESRRPASCDD